MANSTPSSGAAAPYYTMFIDQSAHLDWDWIRTFAQNYWYYDNGSGVNDILTAAIQNAKTGNSKYYYTICEMGFFRRFIETNPAQVATIKTLGDNFQVISGGVTSADYLVCSGEGFIRNYLLGQTWLSGAPLYMTPKPHCWLPDDFGLGPQLPVLLTALGFVSVAFSRLPGTWPGPKLWKPDLQNQLVKDGLDFFWQATDGSKVLAHFLINGYGFGNTAFNYGPDGINCFIDAYGKTDASGNAAVPTYTAAKTPFMYIPIDIDFSMPIDSLQTYISEWNSTNSSKDNVTATQGTFDQFVTGVLQTPDVDQKLKTLNYNTTPFFTGYYASRPELKKLHYETVRALTAAEVIGLLTIPSNTSLNSMLPTDFWARVDQTWNDFAPSTHHDYVCGTAPDAVYANDQLPLLRGAAAAARMLRDIALNALGGMTAYLGSTIVSNSLGFERTGVAAIEGIKPFTHSLSWSDGSSTPTQRTADGGMLVYATVQSLGYTIGEGLDEGSSTTAIDTVTVTPTTSDATSYTISNKYLTATITSTADWGIVSLTDTLNGGAEVLPNGGNAITFYDEFSGDYGGGSIYQFGNEHPNCHMPLINGVTVQTSGAGLGAVVLEQGPLRARLRTEVEFTVNKAATRFVREYELRAGEPFLRMTTTGAAPENTSVMTNFAFSSDAAGGVASITHGTGYHWTDVPPLPGYWDSPIFQATHDFVIPCDAKKNTFAAVYHAAMPAWAFDKSGTLLGCLLRNTPQSGGHGAAGSDPAPHTQQYALRVPTGLGPPESGQPLREAQCFHTPLLAAGLPDGEQYSGMLTDRNASLASVPADSPAILTVAKPCSYDPTSLILRLYQPTLASLTADVSLPSTPSKAKLVTATETEWSGKGSVTTSGNTITVEMAGAVATVEVAAMGRGSSD